MKTAKIFCIQRQQYNGTVFNIELKTNDAKNDDLFWVCNGIVVHNCFPKDLNALVYEAEQLGVDMKVLKAAWAKNLEVRSPSDRDWELMMGRAVSKKSGKK